MQHIFLNFLPSQQLKAGFRSVQSSDYSVKQSPTVYGHIHSEKQNIAKTANSEKTKNERVLHSHICLEKSLYDCKSGDAAILVSVSVKKFT